MCIKDMICDMSSYELDRSVSAGMGISKNGIPIKAFSIHRSCSTPLWKIALFMLGVIAGLMVFCCIKKKCRCNEADSEK